MCPLPVGKSGWWMSVRLRLLVYSAYTSNKVTIQLSACISEMWLPLPLSLFHVHVMSFRWPMLPNLPCFYCHSFTLVRMGNAMGNKAKEECCACEGPCRCGTCLGVHKLEQLTFRREVLVVYFLCSPEAEQWSKPLQLQYVEKFLIPI